MKSRDELSDRYFEIIRKKIEKEEYYWQKKAKNFIKTGSYYETD